MSTTRSDLTEALASHISRCLQLSDPLAIEPLSGGMNSYVFSVRAAESSAYVAKVYRPHNAGRSRREAACLRAVDGRGIAPRVVDFADRSPELGRPVLLYEMLPGQTLRGASLNGSDFEALLDLWRRLHSGPAEGSLHRAEYSPANPLDFVERQVTPNLRWYLGWARQYTGGTAPLQSALVGLALKTLDLAVRLTAGWVEGTRRVCHCDAHLANIVRTPSGEMRLVDWEVGGAGDPAFELAQFVHNPNEAHLVRERREEFVRRHCAQLPDGDAVCRRFRVYNVLEPLRWAANLMCAWAAAVDPASGSPKAHYALPADRCLEMAESYVEQIAGSLDLASVS